MYSPAGSGYGMTSASQPPAIHVDRFSSLGTGQRSPGVAADMGRYDNGYVPGSYGSGHGYPHSNGILSPYGSEQQNPFDQSFDRNLGTHPAMTSSQQDVRPVQPHGPRSPHSGLVSYMPAGGPGGGGRVPYADERLSERGSSIANPLDERFSEAESSVMGYQDPGADPRYTSAPWRPADSAPRAMSPGNIGPPYDGGIPSSVVDPAVYRTSSSDMLLDQPTAMTSPAPMDDTKWRNPDLREVIDYLTHEDDLIKANAAAYLQHLTYMDDNIKAETRVLRGIPALVDLVSHHEVVVYRAACGALRNLTFGKANYKNKKAVKNAGGITALERLLRTTNDMETCELVTGILWNLSSAQELKRFIIDESVQTLVEYIVKPAVSNTGLSVNTPGGPGPGWTKTVFRNVSSILRNVSSDGEYARNKLRDCHGLVDSVVTVVRSSVAIGEMDSKAVENCVCVMRNLSYACQEVTDPDYLRRRETKQASHDDGGSGCFGGKKKSSSKDSSKSRVSVTSRIPRAMSPLWHTDIVSVYLPLLKDCTNPDTLEAAAGAIQNLTAGDWQPAEEIRTAVRQEKGLPIITELLSLNSDRVVCAAATALRNLALDQRNKELIGKYALPHLVRKLPSPVRQSELILSEDTIASVEAALYEIIKTNSTHAKSLISEGGVERLMYITRSPVGSYTEKVVKFATQLLQKLWRFSEFHDEYRRKGWKQSDFASGVGKSLPSSAENTINRPRQGQSGPGHANTTPLDRGLHGPPPYVGLAADPYSGDPYPAVRDSYQLQHSPRELSISGGRYMEMSLQPPGYDSRQQLNGEPPGYLDNSQRDFPHDTNRGYIMDSRGYPMDDRGYLPEMQGYADDERDFRPVENPGYMPQEFPESDRGYGVYAVERQRASVVSYESQMMGIMPSVGSDFRHRDEGYGVATTDSMPVHIRDPANRGYDDREFGSSVPRHLSDRSAEPLYARVHKPNQYGDVQLEGVGDYRANDVDSWV